MKKLNILKKIIDVIWFFAIPTAFSIIILIPFIILEKFDFMTFQIQGTSIKAIDIPSKIMVIMGFLSYLVLIYCIYLFRKILRYFQQLNIFDEFVLSSFKKMGNLLVVSAFLTGIPSFLFRIFNKGEITISVGFSPFFMLLSLGLFSIVLSEILKISKNFKEENDLTI
jgi:hypothetical protein